VDKNELRIGQSRVGELIDGDEATPKTRTQLQRPGDGHVDLYVPWSGIGPDEVYRRWFAGNGISFVDDLDRTKYRYEVPRNLIFQDHLGPVALVGCSSAGYSESWGWGMGAGRARVQYAVLGGRNLSYATISGMKTEITGLHTWLGINSIQVEESHDPRHATYHLDLAPSVEIDGVIGLTFEPVIQRPSGNEGETVLKQSTLVQTLWDEPRRWSDHWRVHRAVRDLVAIAAWRDERFIRAAVSRHDDPLRVATGDAVARNWHDVIAAEVTEGAVSPVRKGDAFLFRSSDLHVSSVAAWIALRDQYSRAVDPIVSTLSMRGATIEVPLALVGIGMEALGYQIAMKNRSKSAANGLSLAERLKVLAADLPIAPPFDIEDWVTGTAEAYNGIKHANRTMPSPIEQLNRVRQSQLVFRMWVAAQLGMGAAELEAAVALDPMTHAYVAAPDAADGPLTDDAGGSSSTAAKTTP